MREAREVEKAKAAEAEALNAELPRHALFTKQHAIDTHEKDAEAGKLGEGALVDFDSSTQSHGGYGRGDAEGAMFERGISPGLSESEPGSPPDVMEKRQQREMEGAGQGRESPVPVFAPKVSVRVPSGETDRDATPPLPAGMTATPTKAQATSAQRSRRASVPSQAAAPGAAGDGAAAFAHVEDIAPVVLPTPVRHAGGGAPGVKLWSGFLDMPGTGMWKVELQSLQGAYDLGRVVRESSISIKGKLPAAALEEFLEKLMTSRTRTVTLGVVRLNRTATDEGALERFQEVRLPASLTSSTKRSYFMNFSCPLVYCAVRWCILHQPTWRWLMENGLSSTDARLIMVWLCSLFSPSRAASGAQRAHLAGVRGIWCRRPLLQVASARLRTLLRPHSINARSQPLSVTRIFSSQWSRLDKSRTRLCSKISIRG
jgi:hypothetical protein